MTPRPELQPFAARLRQAMNGRTSSSVAREIWGTIKDSRGYIVAKNRDRIGHYLDGTSYPEPENLQKLADALGIPVDELRIENPKNLTQPQTVNTGGFVIAITATATEIHIKITPS